MATSWFGYAVLKRFNRSFGNSRPLNAYRPYKLAASYGVLTVQQALLPSQTVRHLYSIQTGRKPHRTQMSRSEFSPCRRVVIRILAGELFFRGRT
jgi:hypothetical protein